MHSETCAPFIEAAVAAIAAGRPVVVAGSMGPTGEIFEPMGKLTHALAVEIASLPDDIRGYGHVKEKAVEAAEKKLAALMAKWNAPAAPRMQAAE